MAILQIGVGRVSAYEADGCHQFFVCGKSTAPMNIHRRFLDIYGDQIVDMITGSG